MTWVCVFDVNETLLDLGALDPLFARLFGNAALRKVWFAQMLQIAFVSTITNSYSSFGTLAIASLEMLAAQQQVTLSEYDRQALRDGMQHLPAHPEVQKSLAMLREAGVRLTALTNSTLQVAEAQLTNAGLRESFEQIFSADQVQRLKPAPEPYHMVANQLGITKNEVLLIAAHSWDIAGALRAGCSAAFIARPGIVLDPLIAKPQIIGKDLQEVATQILAHKQIS